MSVVPFVAQAAWAKETHIFISSFRGEACQAFRELEGVAVDNSTGPDTGDVYVADRGRGVIDRFNAAGSECLGQNSGAGTPQKSFVNGPLKQLAVSPTGGDLFASLSGEGFVDAFDPSEAYLFQISGQSIPEGQVGHPPLGVPFASIAAAVAPSTSEVYVADEANDEVDAFSSTGAYMRQFPVISPPLAIAVDAHNVLYVANTLDVGVYEASTGKLKRMLEMSETETDPRLVVDPNTEDVYVAHRRNPVVNQYNSLGVLVGSFDNRDSRGLADSHGIAISRESSDVYLSDAGQGEEEPSYEVSVFGPTVTATEPTTEAASEVLPESAVLNGEVNPNGLPVKKCYFEYAPVGEPYEDKAQCEHPDAAEILEAEGEYHVHANVKLKPETSYHYRLVAVNAQATLDGSDMAIELPTAEADAVRTIDGQGGLSVFGVVNAGGIKAHYQFEFVTKKAYEESGEGAWAHAVAKSEGEASGEGGGLVVQKVPSTLLAGEMYRYRLTVESTAFPGDPQHGKAIRALTVPVPGSEAQPVCPNEAERTGPSAQLPDCRAYEQVTPVNKEGAQDIFDYGKTVDDLVVGLDGEHLLMYTLSKWGQNVSGAATGTYSFTRTSADWQMSSLSPQPHTGGVLNKAASFYTPDLSQVMLEREWSTSVNAASPSVEFAVGPPGGPYKTVASETQTHVVSASRYHGEEEVAHEGKWVAQSRDGSVAVLESPDHELIAGSRTGTTALNRLDGGQGNQGHDLYEYADGHLSQVNLAPEPEGKKTIGTCGALLAEGREGGGNRGTGQGSENNTGSLETGSVNAVSADGSRIFFEAFPHGCPSSNEESIRSKSGGPMSMFELYIRVNGERTVEIGNYTFEGANPEGTRVFMSRVSGTDVEYFSYDTETQLIKSLFSLKGDSLGAKHALSEDGNVYYFEATGTPLNGEAPANVNDIYRYDIDTETLRFVGISSQNGGEEDGGFYASPGGEDFYFNVETVVGVSGSRGQVKHPVEVYRYSSEENMVQCVSCASSFNPEPKMLSTLMPAFGPSIERPSPLAFPASENGDFVFFDTPSALVAQDINGEIAPNSNEPAGEDFSLDFSPSSDVYEWRKEGVDGCGRVQGCLTLITNGIDGTENVLLGTDPSGRDVFVGTHSQLAPTDADQSGDVYDVRMGGGFPPQPPPPTRCEGDTCSTPAVPPIEVTPTSFTFNGPTDAAPKLPSSSGGARGASTKAVKCAKGRVAVRGRCVKRGARTKAKKARTRSRGARAKRSGRSAGRSGR